MPSTPDPLVEVIARALGHETGDTPETWTDESRAVLAAIAATGRLLPEGAQTKRHYRVTAIVEPGNYHEGERVTVGQDITRRRHVAEATLARVTMPGKRIETRAVHTERWEPSLLDTTPDTTGTEEGA